MQNKLIIGRLEKVSFPDFGFSDIIAKVDTGAYTSSLHCDNIELDGNTLTFVLVHTHGEKKFKTQDFYKKGIRSSNGRIQHRYIIKTKLQLFGKCYKTEFSLTDRSKMKYPVLLGRKVLSGRFIVDVSKKYIEQKS